MSIQKAVFNWSGGKDSALCLHKALHQAEFNIACLLTSVNQEQNRISMHGVRRSLLKQQAEQIDLPLKTLELNNACSMADYDDAMQKLVQSFKDEGIEHSIFGDIFLEDLRQYRERQLTKVGVQAHFPLWKQNTNDLVREFIDLGFKAVTVCIDEAHLDESFVGRQIDDDFLKDLPSEVDPCGENGEFHSFVYDGPIFKKPIPIKVGEKVRRQFEYTSSDDNNDDDQSYQHPPRDPDCGFWFADLIPLEMN